MQYRCGTCDKQFSKGSQEGRQARDDHCRSAGHSVPDFECASCPKRFRSKQAVEHHMSDLGHWTDAAIDAAWDDETWL
jgi:DNA-directed RNA polymerase subunit RPC12/RpoP